MPELEWFQVDPFLRASSSKTKQSKSKGMINPESTIGQVRRELFGHSLPEEKSADIVNTEMPDPSFVGIELELEGGLSTENLPRAFVAENDNSLRNNGIEIKSRRPHRGRALESAIHRLGSFLADSSFSVSERCSTHIHVDVNDLTHQQAVNFLCLSVMLEPMLFNLFGNTRTANNFCMATDMGTTNFSNIVSCVTNPEKLLTTKWSKYAGVGLFRLNDYGTFEFRMFTAVTTSTDMMRVVQMLLAFKSYARTMTSPESVIDAKLAESVESLFTTFFPTEAFTDGFSGAMERGIRTLNDILMSARVTQMIEERSKSYKAVMSEAEKQLKTLSRGI